MQIGLLSPHESFTWFESHRRSSEELVSPMKNGTMKGLLGSISVVLQTKKENKYSCHNLLLQILQLNSSTYNYISKQLLQGLVCLHRSSRKFFPLLENDFLITSLTCFEVFPSPTPLQIQKIKSKSMTWITIPSDITTYHHKPYYVDLMKISRGECIK